MFAILIPILASQIPPSSNGDCPNGMVAVIEDAKAVCRPLAVPTGSPPVQRAQLVERGEEWRTGAWGGNRTTNEVHLTDTGQALFGLRGVPAICDFKGSRFQRLALAEAVHDAVATCVEEARLDVPPAGAAWLPLPMVISKQGIFRVIPEGFGWDLELNKCLARRKLVTDREVPRRSKFTAWFPEYPDVAQSHRSSACPKDLPPSALSPQR